MKMSMELLTLDKAKELNLRVGECKPNRVIISGEAGLSALTEMIRNSWKSGYPLIIKAEEVRFEKDK